MYRTSTGFHGIINVTGFYFPFTLLFLTSIFPVKIVSWLKNCGCTGIHHPSYLQSQPLHLQFREEWERGGKQKVPAWLSKPPNKLYWSCIQLFLLVYQQALLSLSMAGWRFIFDRHSSILQQIISWIDIGSSIGLSLYLSIHPSIHFYLYFTSILVSLYFNYC